MICSVSHTIRYMTPKKTVASAWHKPFQQSWQIKALEIPYANELFPQFGIENTLKAVSKPKHRNWNAQLAFAFFGLAFPTEVKNWAPKHEGSNLFKVPMEKDPSKILSWGVCCPVAMLDRRPCLHHSKGRPILRGRKGFGHQFGHRTHQWLPGGPLCWEVGNASWRFSSQRPEGSSWAQALHRRIYTYIYI